jgi:exodeoxyribonuclease VII small subunit
MTEQPLTFEAAMARLEAIVAELESGKLPLDESLRKFEEGIALGKTCRDFLDRADLRIRTLTAAAGADDEPVETEDDGE